MIWASWLFEKAENREGVSRDDQRDQDEISQERVVGKPINRSMADMVKPMRTVEHRTPKVAKALMAHFCSRNHQC